MVDGLEEPLLDINEIQGNSVPGFNKDYQRFLFFDIFEPVLAKRWLSYWTPYVSTAQGVIQFNHFYQLMRERRGEEPDGIMATWLKKVKLLIYKKGLYTYVQNTSFVKQY